MTEEVSYRNITCPFCGLACDDLSISLKEEKLAVTENGCGLSISGFSRTIGEEHTARIGGKPAEYDKAIEAASNILKNSSHPLFSGLMTDVSGMRAILQLADRCGAILDHPNSAGFSRNLAVIQQSGWIATTLSEVKNRMDLLVVIGTDIVSRFPRFFERLVWNQFRLFDEGQKREIIFIGNIKNADAATSPSGVPPTVISCEQTRLTEIVLALRTLAAGKRIKNMEVANVKTKTLEQLVEKMRVAKYGVLCWAAGDLDFAHAELTVQNIGELLKELNRETRFSGLPLGGNDADLTANQVCTWQIGFPLPLSLAGGKPDYDSIGYRTNRLLENREVDSLLWVSSYRSERTPPETSVPRIVLGKPDMKCISEPEVFIPVATPGVDHAGHFFRTDNVVSLPLRALRKTKLRPVYDVIQSIAQALA